MERNVINPLLDTQNASVDDSLTMLQVRVRKGTVWEHLLREWLTEMGKKL